MRSDGLEGSGAIASDEGLVPLGLQAEPEHPHDLRLVLDDQHAGRAPHRPHRMEYGLDARPQASDRGPVPAR
jgi:hypothetical protein